MVITVAPLLLLLLFPVSGSEVPSTVLVPPDIHSVLREMSAKLAEQTVEIRHLLQENKEHSVKLQQLDVQKAELEGQKAELEGQKAEVEKLKRQLEAQAAELTSMKTKSNITENQVEALNRDSTVSVKRVAFSASLLESGHGTTGPFNTHVPLRYRRVVTNIGNAYNRDTGFFIAPVRAVYHFQWYVCAHTTSSQPSGAVLIMNGIPIFIAYERQHAGLGSSSNGVSLLMEVGDVVFLRLWSGSKMFDNENHHSTFSGHLLFTM